MSQEEKLVISYSRNGLYCQITLQFQQNARFQDIFWIYGKNIDFQVLVTIRMLRQEGGSWSFLHIWLI